MSAAAHRSYFLHVMGALIALTWLLLWIWEQSPYGRYLNHGQWDELGIAVSICRVIPQGGFVVPAFLYVVGWTLMTAAMMLPTTLPLLEIFRRLTRRRADQSLLVALVITGYLGVWGAFGVVAHGVDWALLEVVEQSPWLQLNAWVFGAATLTLAGTFQFSRLKYRCLDRCRAPLSFVLGYWKGKGERFQAFLLGANHGLYCVGCCWALMLLMFVVGTGNVGWMLALGAVMAIEKNMPWGRKLSTPLGIGLIAWGAMILLNHSWSWQA
jgi:predicted metal-binding membrane protein